MSLLTSLLHYLEPDILPYVTLQLILQVSQQVSDQAHTCSSTGTLLDHQRRFLNGKRLSGKTIHGLNGEYGKENSFLVLYFSLEALPIHILTEKNFNSIVY